MGTMIKIARGRVPTVLKDRPLAPEPQWEPIQIVSLQRETPVSLLASFSLICLEPDEPSEGGVSGPTIKRNTANE